MGILRTLFIYLFAPLYCKIIKLIAYGPWGSWVHQRMIRWFQKQFKIEWENTKNFKKLGDFFLREPPLQISSASLVSPAEALLLEGPKLVENQDTLAVKGLIYRWSKIPEFKNEDWWKRASYYNFYLSPSHYHWVHAPSEGHNLIAYRHSGKFWPVNEWGRNCEPSLYSENERLTFRYHSEEFGEVAILNVGAMGVSSILSPLGECPYGKWTHLSERIKKGQQIAGFQLGSTVLLVVERLPPTAKTFKPALSVLRVGDALSSFDQK